MNVRQSTAGSITVGPVLDADGNLVTDCVIGDFKISKNGAAPAALNESATLTHRHTGHYSLGWTTSDVDTVGTADIVIDDTVNACAPVRLQVIEEAIYDAFYAASATPDSFKATGFATPTNVSDAQTAIINAVNAVNTGAARYISIHTSAAYEIPDSGSVAYPIEIRTFDADGEPAAIDAVADPTVTVTRTTDSADLSGNLAAFSSPATAVYRTTLTITQGSDTVAPLRIDASGAIATVTRSTSAYPVITDAVAVDFTATDRANLAAILEDTGTTIPAQITNRTLLAAEYGTAANQTTLLNRLGAFTGTGVNTVLGFFKALFNADSTLPSDIGGAYSPATMSLETNKAEHDTTQLAVAAIEGAEGTGANSITPTVTDGTDPLESAKVRFTKGAESYLQSTNASGTFSTPFALDNGTWTVTITLPGYTFATTTLVVTGNATPTYAMTATGLSVPESPRIRARLLVLDATTKLGLPDVSLTVTVAGAAAPAGYGSRVTSRTITSDANGLAEWYALPGEDYAVTGPSGTEYTIRIPATATDPHSLTSILI